MLNYWIFTFDCLKDISVKKRNENLTSLDAYTCLDYYDKWNKWKHNAQPSRM
jgi:hypothetical protein